ncbi:hypothetical protein A1E_00960 [Rickettsia canadensis str. McKiel]|uniref:Uncharacterized protein n=1 Tax=Rickettsia canadensis (strain McKiel) TaxID=293613 RepID=A8EXQ7_RICCK|nr:hypothetical protein A1E_00960 [Rickettsia canadensis str. McKiel]
MLGGWPPLDYAISNNNIEIANFVLQSGVHL